MDTYLDITYSYCLSVQNSEWTNSAKHSGLLNVWLGWTAMNLPLQKLSPVSTLLILWFLVAVLHSVECVEGVGGLEELFFIGLGKVNVILLTEWQEESNQCLRWSDISSNPSLKLFFKCYLSAQIFVILSVNVSTAGPSGRAV